jgi:endo-1,4-beta-D-glucanase Y
MKHKHHIIPKHAGGTDDPSNLVELTIEEHAEAHRILFEQYGRWQDEIAWKTLSGQITQAEAIKESQKNANKSWMKTEEGRNILKGRWETRRKNGTDVPWNKGLTKEDSDSLKKLSEWNLKYREEGKLSNIGDIVRGTVRSEKHRKNLSISLQKIKKIKCEHCNRKFKPGMFKRWHGDNCKKGRKNPN